MFLLGELLGKNIIGEVQSMPKNLNNQQIIFPWSVKDMNYSVFTAKLKSSYLDKINALQRYKIKASRVRSTFYFT